MTALYIFTLLLSGIIGFAISRVGTLLFKKDQFATPEMYSGKILAKILRKDFLTLEPEKQKRYNTMASLFYAAISMWSFAFLLILLLIFNLNSNSIFAFIILAIIFSLIVILQDFLLLLIFKVAPPIKTWEKYNLIRSIVLRIIYSFASILVFLLLSVFMVSMFFQIR